MASNYYLIASLPMLRFDDAPPITSEQFLALCQQALSRKEFLTVQAFVDGTISSSTSRHPYIVAWNTFVKQLQATLYDARMNKLERKVDSKKVDTAKNRQLEAIVKDAMQAANPLEAELILIRAYWQKATELIHLQIFTTEVVYTYAIQLSILERKSLFTPLEGDAEFKRLFSNLQSIIKSI